MIARWTRAAAPTVLCLCAGCRDVDRFDTTGDDAFCGSIVDAQFVRTTTQEGGFERALRMRLEIDVEALTTVPGTVTTDDAADGPCSPLPTFDGAPLLATPEVQHDPISMLSLGESHEENLVTWVESTCRGPMLAVVSLLTSGDVEVRLLKPPEIGQDVARPGFALFELSRRREECGF